ncbi:ankyrin repeat domain-containing protein [Candidatus Jidaibacter acanthamoebae]|nr:ankyrin repeat domain-containing protein [Candidatus Jidaibacter acanthamoeba]
MLNHRSLKITYTEKTRNRRSIQREEFNYHPLRTAYIKKNQKLKVLLKHMLYGSEEEIINSLKTMPFYEYILIKDDIYEANIVLWAVLRRQLNVLNYLLQEAHRNDKIILDAEDKDKNNCFIYAAFIGNLHLVKAILKLNRNYVDSVNIYGENGLMAAIVGENPEVVRYLLKTHCNLINLSDNEGYNAFLIAAYKNNAEVMTELLAINPELINSVSTENENAFIIRENINTGLLLLSYNIKTLKINNTCNVKKWLALLGLSSKEEFGNLQQQVNDMGRKLIFLHLKIIEEVLSDLLPPEIIEHIVYFFSHPQIADIYPNIAIEYQLKPKYLELLKQRCAREILQESYPDYSLIYSPETDYIKVLEQKVYQALYEKNLPPQDDNQLFLHIPCAEKKHLLTTYYYLNVIPHPVQVIFTCEIKFPPPKHNISTIPQRYKTQLFTSELPNRGLKHLDNLRREGHCLQ